MHEDQLVEMFEENRKGRLNEVVHEYLNDGGATSELFLVDLRSILEGHAAHKAEEARVAQEAALAASEAARVAQAALVDKVEDQNAAQFDADQAAQSIHWIDEVAGFAGTAFDAPDYTTATYATAEVTGTVNIDTSIYPPDHPYHVDTSVAAGSTAAYPTATYNVDTTTYGDVSIASSEANPYGYYDHDLGGAFYVDGHSDVQQVPEDVTTYTAPPQTGVIAGYASSEQNPDGYYSTNVPTTYPVTYDEANNVDPQVPEDIEIKTEPDFDPLAVPSKFDAHN
jgi:hypothetical protein